MIKSNGGIIGPDNVTTGGINGVASGVFKLGEVTDLIRQSKWPEISPFPNTVSNSLRFNRASSDSLNKTFGTPTNSKKLTISFWTKLIAESGNDHHAFSNGTSNADESLISFINSGSHNLEIKEDVSSSATYQFVTNRIFRDPLAFYHIVIAWDTTQSTESNRLKLYINGVQETSLATANYPNLNQDIKFNTAIAQYIGKRNRNEGAFYNGYMAEVIFIDGTQLTPTSFGEFNSDSGIWIPKTITGLTFGNNGFYQKYTNASALGEDFSGEDNDFAVTNITTLDQTSDSPSNNFSTLNSLEYSGGGKTFSEGNTKQFLTGVSNFTRSSIGVAKGKWYCEVKLISGTRAMYGISSYLSNAASNYIGELGNTTVGYSYGIIGNTGRLYHAGSSTANWVSTFANSNIIMLAMDLDNYKLYFGKNGTWERSGDPTSGSTGTGAYTIVAPSLSVTGFYHFAFGCNSTGEDNTSEMNFGNPPFALSSAVTDGNGFGNFEYTVPTGYLSLCTNNLNILE